MDEVDHFWVCLRRDNEDEAPLFKISLPQEITCKDKDKLRTIIGELWKQVLAYTKM